MRTSTWNWNVSDLVRSPLRRTLSWGKTLKISTETPARNWIVNDLLGSHRIMLSREKTGKTSTSSTTTNNWNVDVLLHNPLQRGEGNDRRHFNQLFNQLRRRIIESRKQRDRIDDLLHGAPLCPLLRS